MTESGLVGNAEIFKGAFQLKASHQDLTLDRTSARTLLPASPYLTTLRSWSTYHLPTANRGIAKSDDFVSSFCNCLPTPLVRTILAILAILEVKGSKTPSNEPKSRPLWVSVTFSCAIMGQKPDVMMPFG